ncbi:MAG TPA: G1 family glutamic endopeptidase [Acidimicrobiales bacterium]|nr:G1 family glutamic endopeptidase [Acidimicrobiales bacterium]
MRRIIRITTTMAVAALSAAAMGSPALAATAAGAHAHTWSTHRTDRHVPNLQLVPGQKAVAGAVIQSGNWSGYQLSADGTGTTPSVAVPAPYTSVSGEWVVPTAIQETPGQAEYGANWIGIGGGNDNPNQPTGSPTLIQTGVGEDVSAGGVASYYAWYEIIPEPETQVSMPVGPGDLVTATITQSSTPGSWNITMDDHTNGQSFTESIDYPSTMDTAEWILESPTEINGASTGVATLPNLGTSYFKNSTVNGGPAPLSSGFAIQLNPSSGVVAAPSAPGPTGTDFNVCTYSGTACAAPGRTSTGSGTPPNPACVPLFTGSPGESVYPPGAGSDYPNLDVIQADMRNDGTSLTTILTIENMQEWSPTSPPGGTANEYYLLWTYGGTVYYTNAQIAETGDTFSYGTKATTGYTAGTGSVTGKIVDGPDGTITVTVPLSDLGAPATGDTLMAPNSSVSVLAGTPQTGGLVLTASDVGPGNNYVLGETCPSTGVIGSDGGVSGGPGGGQVPEAPVAAAIPLLGLTVGGGLVLAGRRRRRSTAEA